MSKQYYIENMCWGWFMGGVHLYLYWGEEFRYQALLYIVVICGIVLYPLSKWAVEWFFLKFTTREF